MIKPGEIQNKARKSGVRDQQIEKDYVLSWVLLGIANNQNLSEIIVFKGGTALKKVYFEDYRFSEDLDFTLIDNDITTEQILKLFREVFEYVKEEANIPLEIIDPENYRGEHENGGINFYISYVGPLGGMGVNKKIKIDISRSEKLEFMPVKLMAFCSYSDQKEHKLLTYQLEEILAEKLRYVMQRMQARDLYDIWFLLEIHGLDVQIILNEFKAKCESKGIDPTEFHTKLEQRLPQYKGRWKNSLSDQIKDLPDYEKVEREVMRQLKNLNLK